VRKTYEYTLLPTPEQERLLATVVWRCRELSTAGLRERKAAWEQCGVCVSFALHSAQPPAIKEVRPDYGDRNAQVLQAVLHRLDNAFAACFRRIKVGERPGYPRLQGTDRYHSFTSPQMGAHGGAVLDGAMLRLSKIGRLPIRLRLHRPLQGIPKTVTISREADGWYACSSCAEVPAVSLPSTGHETGIDVGLKVFLITADRHPSDNPRYSCRAERPLARAQRRVSRRKRGSNRRKKAVAPLTRTYQRVQRQRRHFQHTTALDLLRAYDTLSLDEVPVRTLVRNHSFAKSIGDAGMTTVSHHPRSQGSMRWASGDRGSRRRTPARTAVACCLMAAAVCSG
jgi:putative transposase